MFCVLSSMNIFREQIDVTCYILNSVLSLLDAADIVTTLSSPIQNCLNHANPTVQLLALKQVRILVL